MRTVVCEGVSLCTNHHDKQRKKHTYMLMFSLNGEGLFQLTLEMQRLLVKRRDKINLLYLKYRRSLVDFEMSVVGRKRVCLKL